MLAAQQGLPRRDELQQHWEAKRDELARQVRASAQLVDHEAELLDIHALAEAVRKANPGAESQGLNTLAALILLQDPTRRFTAAELGSELYPGADPAKAANNAGALLHHSLEGRPGRAGRTLAESGYRLVREPATANEPDDQGEMKPGMVYGIQPIEPSKS